MLRVILEFLTSQGSTATQLMWGRRHCNSYTENFIGNLSVKEFWKLVNICQSYGQKSSVLFLF